MSRFPSCSNAKIVILMVVSVLAVRTARPAGAASCNNDVTCVHALDHAKYLRELGQTAAAINELQSAFSRLSDPRLLVSIGNYQYQQGQSGRSRDSCQRAKALAPTDADLQQEASECLARATAEPQTKTVNQIPSVVTKTEANGGFSNTDVGVNINDSFKQITTLNPTIISAPVIQLPPLAASAPSTSPKPLYRCWWFWSGLGVLATGAVGLGLGLASRGPSTDGYPSPYHFSQSLHTNGRD